MTSTIEKHLMYKVRKPNDIVMRNVYLLGSPWECDVVRVTPAGYFTEYEVKKTRSDFQADFRKTSGWRENGQGKHDVYSGQAFVSETWRRIRIPKQFYFVLPTGMVQCSELPDHAGLIEFSEVDERRLVFSTVRKAPRIKHCTKIDADVVWNLAVKASWKLMFGRAS